jgi:predicted nucleotidyltransferase
MGAQVYTMAEIMPEQKDVEKIVTAKLSYDKAKSEKSTADFDAWINDRAVFFKVAPRGLAYTVSQKSYSTYAAKCRQNRWKTPKPYAPQALRYFVIAVTIGWTELVDELKKILKYWDFTSADLQQYAKDVWQVPANIDTIAQMIDQVQQSNKITLVEAVEKHAKLNSKLFTKDEVLKETVRKKMLEIVDEFLDNLKEQNIEIKVKDILLVGSNANYNYTKDSDIDLHIIADTKNMKYEMEIANALYSAYRTLFNKNLDINIYDIPLELYVEVENTPRNSNGVYSIKKDKWEKKPVQEDIPEYDTEALGKLVDKWEKKCKDLLDKIAADKLDDEKQVVKLIEDIYEKLRKAGVAKSEYAVENLAFKELRNKGYLDKLKVSKHELISKRLSLEEKLDRQARNYMYTQITRTAGSQPIIQDNGMFFIYNIKANEISRTVNALRKLPFVTDVYSHENGKYDFSNVLEIAMNKMPSKYYDIRGTIDTSYREN